MDEIIILDNKDSVMCMYHDAVLGMGANGIGAFKTDPESGEYQLGDLKMKVSFIEEWPTNIKASDVSDKFFFSTSGSKVWNFVANQSFFSFNFSETQNKYFDNWPGYTEDQWDGTHYYLHAVLACFVRKYGDANPQVYKDAVLVLKHLGSHNRNEIHYDVAPIKEGQSAFEAFMYEDI